jgi:hypothetical protein
MNRKRPTKAQSQKNSGSKKAQPQKKARSKKGTAKSFGVLRDPKGSVVKIPRVYSKDCENALVLYQRLHEQWIRAGSPKTGTFADAQVAAWNGVRLKCGFLPKV